MKPTRQKHAIRLTSLVAMLTSACLMCACLDDQPKDRLDENEVYTTSEGLIHNTVTTLYYYIGGHTDGEGLQGTCRGIYDLNELTTDEAIIPTRGGDWYDGGLWQSLFLHTWDAGNSAVGNAWKYLYKVIVMCNHSLAMLHEHRSLLSDSQLDNYTAEVRAIRAMYYYYLLDLFGRVPLVVSEDTPFDQVMQSERSSVFQFVFKELQEAEPYLARRRSNYEGDYYGRVTAPVAWFLMAKLALNAEVYADDQWTDDRRPSGNDITFHVLGREMNAWETCIYYCDMLSAMGYQLDEKYQLPFDVNNERSVENIFTIPMDKTLYTNEFQYLFRSRHYNHGAAFGMASENGTSATTTAVKTFGYHTDNLDQRFEHNFFFDSITVDMTPICLDNGQLLVYQPLAITSVDITGQPYEKTAGARMYKYAIDRTAYADGKLQDNDIVLFRYADVLLMRAEAMMRNGGDAFSYYNMVRRRAGMPLKEPTLQLILTERMLELCWEGWRRQDMIRFDVYHLAYDVRPQLPLEPARYTVVFPIPGFMLDKNKNLTQNPGY